MEEWELLPDLRVWRAGQGEGDALLLLALRRALCTLRGLTGLIDLPPALAPAALELACALLSRRGSEGESARREGSLSVSYDGLSPETVRLIRRYRPAVAGCPDAP